ncbi:type I restriction-modification system subunit M [Burkholderia pseudomallei]|uniref:type I restriction-modification system subunit M n=1 Tax=Burkholderia pseudomallei TaxID=28450 RepID=UPI00201A2662|nr:class I SAM-dependent DNA methyltransferase [Burkholderia pseudomallei]MCL4670363.1 type I restriction-modification system subunit M [Burkholderia pseudomallei]
MAQNFSELANFIWSVADLLRGDYKQADYGKIILPLTLLRRLDCVLESAKQDVLDEYAKRKDSGVNLDVFLNRKSKQAFYNVSPFTVPTLLSDPANIRHNLVAYIGDFSVDAREVFERFKFVERVAELDEKNLLFMLVQKFADIDLHPDVVPNETMGLVFEELIRRFAEASNETAGEHYTPREVIQLIVHCLFAGDDEALSKPGVVRSMYDPTAGTGGILSVGEAVAKSINKSAKLVLFGQELNDESYAICKADLLIKGQDPKNIVAANTLSADGFASEKFDYGAANPPFGVDWKKVQEFVKNEHEKKGYGGRFGPGLPRISDGSMLFLLHLISKMRPADEGGGRVGIVLNGSPLFTGDAGSGESEIRRWILERDLLDAIIALPNDLFYNTGIATYIWILDNNKSPEREDKVQLVDATRMYAKMKKSLGNKRVYLTDEQIGEIVKAYSGMKEDATFSLEYKESKGNGNGNALDEESPARVVSKVFDRRFFGYRKVTIDRPLADGKTAKFKKGEKPYDKDLRDTENVPLLESVDEYFKREVLPHVPDAWVNTDIKDEKDGLVGKVGYEINFNRYFYVYKPPRKPEVIAAEIREMEKRFVELMKGVLA